MNDKPDAAAALAVTEENLAPTGHAVTLKKVFALARHQTQIVQGII
jgi:hypothetical protein